MALHALLNTDFGSFSFEVIKNVLRLLQKQHHGIHRRCLAKGRWGADAYLNGQIAVDMWFWVAKPPREEL